MKGIHFISCPYNYFYEVIVADNLFASSKLTSPNGGESCFVVILLFPSLNQPAHQT